MLQGLCGMQAIQLACSPWFTPLCLLHLSASHKHHETRSVTAFYFFKAFLYHVLRYIFGTEIVTYSQVI